MPGGSSAQGKRLSSIIAHTMHSHGEGLNLPAAAVRLGLREMRGRLRRSGPREGAVSTPTRGARPAPPHGRSFFAHTGDIRRHAAHRYGTFCVACHACKVA